MAKSETKSPSQSLMQKLAEAEEEHRRRMEEKDRAFKEAMDAIDTQFNSHKKEENQRWSTLDEIKKELNECYEKSGLKEEKRRKEERLREVERQTASSELKERLSSTWYELELNSTAHLQDVWCMECKCIHTSDVLHDESD